MPEIDVRLDTGELDVKLRLHTERAIPILDIEFAKGVTVNGNPDSFREFFIEGLDLINATCPPPPPVYDSSGYTRQELIDAAVMVLHGVEMPHLAEAIEALAADIPVHDGLDR